MNKTLKQYNFLWKDKIGRELTEEEFEPVIKKYPNLMKAYTLQEQLANKYKQ